MRERGFGCFDLIKGVMAGLVAAALLPVVAGGSAVRRAPGYAVVFGLAVGAFFLSDLSRVLLVRAASRRGADPSFWRAGNGLVALDLLISALACLGAVGLGRALLLL